MLSSMRVTFSVAGEAAAAGVGNIAVVFAGTLAFSRAAPATASGALLRCRPDLLSAFDFALLLSHENIVGSESFRSLMLRMRFDLDRRYYMDAYALAIRRGGGGTNSGTGGGLYFDTRLCR